jgi:hypothetical protein
MSIIYLKNDKGRVAQVEDHQAEEFKAAGFKPITAQEFAKALQPAAKPTPTPPPAAE